VTFNSNGNAGRWSASRRGFLGGVLGLAAAGSVQAGLAQDASPEASPAGAGWSFTDDKGVTIELPERPTRIVADVNAAAPLWDFGIRPIAVFGWNATLTEDGDFGAAGGRIDPSQVEIVGDEVETIRLEDALSLDPDLIITLTWAPEEPDEYWSIDVAVVDRVKEIAPILALSATGRADVNLARSAELAEALGADLSTPEQLEQKARFETALEGFEAVAAEKADLTNVFGYIDTTEMIYIANPPDWGDLAWYRELGLNIIDPEANPLDYWQELSREGALIYPSDIFWQSTRPGTLSIEELQADAVLSGNPAIKAGQIGLWNQDYILSYQGMADALENLSTVLSSAEKFTE
jgi:iron complex transport system substrate-binding protein